MTDDVSVHVEGYKKRGNALFQKEKIADAIQAYTDGINAWKEGADPNLKAALLSNRAACYLKDPSNLEICIRDCVAGLEVIGQDDSIRSKLLYRRAKAYFLLSELPRSYQQSREEGDVRSSSTNHETLLQDAAKDLLTLLSLDKNNRDASTLLQTIRAKHSLTKGTPVSQTVAKLETGQLDGDEQKHQFKILLGLLTDDSLSAALELGRRRGVPLLMKIGGWQVLACACSDPRFVREFGHEIDQNALLRTVRENEDYSLHAMSIWLRLVLYLDDLNSTDETSLVTDDLVVETVKQAIVLESLLPAGLDLLSSWTALDREGIVLASTEVCLLRSKTESELRSMKPREVAVYKKRVYERKQRDLKWAKNRSLLFCRKGGLEEILNASVNCKQNAIRKEIIIVVGRLLASIQDDEDVERVCKDFLGADGVKIEEISEEKTEEHIDKSHVLDTMKRAQFVSSMLLGKPEAGAAAMKKIKEDLRELIVSDDPGAMSVASEVISAAASVEKARPVVSSMLSSGTLEILLQHCDHDIRSGAATAVAKLGMADKTLSENEGEVMGLLQIGVELLFDEENQDSSPEKLRIAGDLGSNSIATSSVERGIEILGYLATKTQVKEELAHGFRSSAGSKSALERLVDLANRPKAGEALTAYALASVFSLMPVTTETLRREAFIGKEITMEQYDELQAMGKTPEEKEMEPSEPDDSEQAVQERADKMANANVPKAMVNLMKGATETTTERLVVGLNRLAVVQSIRGLLIQQGVLSCCINFENQHDHSSDCFKNTVRQARHCIAKVLVTTNPGLLTNSQRIGSIKPLILLIRDTESSSLQQFEALLAVTNLASVDEQTQQRIISEKGISTLSYAMFSDHEMVRTAATEAICNLVGHPAVLKHLSDPENSKLWMAFSADYEENFNCSRAAIGCLAMAASDPAVAKALVALKSFRESMTRLLESGNLELMHRALVLVQNLVDHGGACQEAVTQSGIDAFCRAYADSYHDGTKAADMQFTTEQRHMMEVTVDLAINIARQTPT